MCLLLVPVFQGFLFLLQPLTVLMKQTRQAARAVKQSIWMSMVFTSMLTTTSMDITFIKNEGGNYVSFFWIVGHCKQTPVGASCGIP